MFLKKECCKAINNKIKSLYFLKCDWCGKEFIRKPTYQKGDVLTSKHYCGRGCSSAQANWKGGRYTTPDGYVYLSPDGKQVTEKILEHRWVMENFLGRKLLKEEIVHHINGKRNDNRIENLQLRATKSHHEAGHEHEYIQTINALKERILSLEKEIQELKQK